MTDRLPTLTPEDLAEPSKLGGLIDAVVVGDDNYRRLTACILEAQDRLQQLVSEDAWPEYLDLEALVNSRVNCALLTAVSWAFNEGRRGR